MSWARIDDGFHDHPKVDELSLAAVGLWTLSLTWAHRHRRTAITAGHLTEARVRKIAGKQAESLASELVSARLWEIEQHIGGWVIHDFADYLPRERDPEERKQAGRKGAASRWKGHSKPDGKQPSPSMASDSSRASAPASPSRPVTTEDQDLGGERNEPIRETDATQHPQDEALPTAPADARCTRHRGVRDPGPCNGCRVAREKAQREADRAEERARAEMDNAVRGCPDCHGSGWREDSAGLPAGKCTHPNLRRSA